MEHTTDTASKKIKSPKFVRWAVMLGIVVVLNIFFLVARTLFLPMPQMQDYCPTQSNPSPQTEQSCAATGGVWNAIGSPSVGSKFPMPPTPAAQGGYCDLMAKCQPVYEHAYQQYQMYSFIIEVGLGVLAIIVGVLPVGSSIVSTGLSYGGVVAFIIASAQYWTSAGNWLRFSISLLALAALIYIGIKRFRD